MRRRPLLLVAPLLVGLLASCSSIGPQPVASIGGKEVSDADLRLELDQLGKNDKYRGAYEQQVYGVPLRGQSRGTYSREFATGVLSESIYYEMLDEALQRAGEVPGGKEIADGKQSMRDQVDQILGDPVEGNKLFNSFPDAYVDLVGRRNALFAVALKVQQDKLGSAFEYYDSHKAEFAQTCVSHILVSNSRDGAEARAQALKAQLDAGADFAKLARTESDDSQNAGTGGDLGCGPAGQFVAEFETAMQAAPVGEPVGPVKTNFGYHIILVRSRQVAPFDQVQSQAEQAVASAGQASFNAFLASVTCNPDVKVTINSKYGTWDRSKCATAGFARVVPPAGPTTTTTASG